MNEYNFPLMVDRHRDDLIKGLSYEQIRRKIPNLLEGEQYPPDSYKGKALRGYRSGHPEARMLWFNKEDGCDQVIIIDRESQYVTLIKG